MVLQRFCLKSFPSKTLFVCFLLSFIYQGAQALPGFYKNTESEVSAVQKCSQDVFKLVILGAQDENGFKKLKKEEIPVYRKEIQKGYSEGQLSKVHFEAMNLQLKDCEAKGEKGCVLFKDLHEATGFFADIEGQSFLWTNAHFIDWRLKASKTLINVSISNPEKRESYYHQATNRLLYGDTKPVLTIFNKKNEVVYHGEAQIQIQPKQTRKSLAAGSFFAEDNDYVGLTLKSDLAARPFHIGQIPSEDPSVYLMGYPSCTNCESSKAFGALENHDRWPFPNAAVSSFVTTRGNIFDADFALSLLDMGSQEKAEYQMENILFYDADSIYGMSGSPILNEACQVVGIHSGGKSYSVMDKTLRVGRGVRPMAWDLMKSPNPL